jgi:hypothetical protein
MAKKYTGRSGAAARASGINVDRPDIQARKAAAASMKQAGVQSLSGLSGSQGQVARFKTEQNNLRNEYSNKDTSDERKKEILQDLRGVSRDLNNQNKAAAINQIIREFGPDAVTNTGNIKGREAGARFQQLRGNPDYFQDGLAGLNTFVGIQRDFKEGDRDLFKKVHPNPFAKMLGMGVQAYKNLSPLGLVQNLEKIRKGEKLIPVPDWMKRNMSESPSRMKDFYSAYIDDKNKDIAIAKADEDESGVLAKEILFGLGDEDESGVLAKEILFGLGDEDPTGDPTRIAEDKDLQKDMERSLLNQYSLLQDDSLADTLLDETEETDLAEAINPESEQKRGMDPKNVSSSNANNVLRNEKIRSYLEYLQTPGEEDPGYEQEFMDTYGYRFDSNFDSDGYGYYDYIPEDRKEMKDRIQGRNTYYSRDLIDERTPVSNIAPNIIEQGTIGYPYGFEEPVDTIFSDVQTEMPKLGSEIRTVDFRNLGYKDGGDVDTYKMLKLINDTMNDG